MAKTASIYKLEPQGLLDRGDARVMSHEGAEVQKIQPVGTPRNGTMGQCFVQTLDGDFIGLVNLSSLKPTDQAAPLRDKATEAREARSRRLRR